MVYCAAFGCTNVHRKGCGKSFVLTFPKDSVRRKKWTFFCKREAFVPTQNHRLFSDHFSDSQFHRNPVRLEQLGYDGARIQLKPDAIPDILLPNNENGAMAMILPSKPRGTYFKRQKADILRQALEEMEPRESDNSARAPVETEPQPVKITDPTCTQPSFSHDAESTPDVGDVQPSTDESFDPTETQSKRCQAYVPVPQMATRIQVSMVSKEMVSRGTQCSGLSDGIPLRVAAGLNLVPQQSCDVETPY